MKAPLTLFALLVSLLGAGSALAQVPDLTASNPDMTLDRDPFNLGPTGMKGRIFF